MAEWSRRRAGVVATAASGAAAVALTGLVLVHDRGPLAADVPGTVAAAMPTPGTGPRPTAGPVAPDERRDFPRAWTAQDPSVEAPPAAVVAAAAPQASEDRLLRVVSVVNRDGEPVVVVERARGPQAAAAVVERRQESDATVAVSVDTRLSVDSIGSRAAADATDPLRSKQWPLDRLGAERAWADYSTGGGSVVAVVDTGVDGNHPDLAGQLTTAGADYVADGGDGRVDPHGHGTHVAGIVAAVRGNDVGVVGLAPSTRLMPIRVLDATGSGWSSDIAQGIIYAADHGADVVNLSLGGPAEDAPTRTAVNYAMAQGVVVVAAAGNARTTGNPTNYPAAYPGVLAVASTESDDTSSTFSNTGSYVDIAAPGGRVLSTVPGGYGYKSGTSMATPYVAATAALVTDITGGTLTTEQFEARLTTSALDLGTTGWDPEFGYGLIDPHRTLCSFTTCDAGEEPTPANSPAPDSPSVPVPTSPSGTVTQPPSTPSPTSPSPTSDPSPRARSVRLTFTTSGGTVRSGRRVLIGTSATDADTGDPLPGQRIVLVGRRDGAIVLRRALTTDADGAAAVRVRLGWTTRFDLRSAATDTTYAATSPTSIRWRVR